jgi:hypothetical protein
VATKSGIFWVTWANAHAQNSTKVEHLTEPFRSPVKTFIAALTVAGAKVDVSTTKRCSRRAYLFHWSWLIALRKCKPSDAKTLHGVDIQWDHGDDAASKRGAQETVTGFGLAVPPKSDKTPSLTSNHITGRAIDMDITWTGTIPARVDLGIGVTGEARRVDGGLDLDGDGTPENFTQCSISEGVSFGVWRGTPYQGVALWSGYYYLGYDTEANCPP